MAGQSTKSAIKPLTHQDAGYPSYPAITSLRPKVSSLTGAMEKAIKIGHFSLTF